jgi:hypothetical protein
VTGNSRNPVPSIAAASSDGSPDIFPSRALIAISQIDAADTYTSSAATIASRAAR